MCTPATSDATLHRRTLRFLVAVAAEHELPWAKVSGGRAAGEGHLYSIEAKEGKIADAATPPQSKKRKLTRSSSKLREPLRDTTNIHDAMDKEPVEELEQESNSEHVAALQAKIEALVQADEPISRVTRSVAQAILYFEQRSLTFAQELLAGHSPTESVELYECNGVLRPALFPLYTSAGALAKGSFKLLSQGDGFVASHAQGTYVPQPTMVEMQEDHFAFGKSQGVNSLDALNALKSKRERLDYALHCEFRQEAKLAEIARQVKARQGSSPVNVICIAGPTSSGKTTFSNKLCMYLRNAGIFGQPLSIDDYYLPLDEQPKYKARREITDIDFDAPESLDWKLVHEHINALTTGQSCMMPVYNMRTSNRDPPGYLVQPLPANGVLVIEGIHALSPHFTEGMDRSHLFSIFISPVTALQIDDENAVKTTDHRLLRKLCRDFKFRGRSASRTLMGWVKARAGEKIYVFPHQNEVDFVMNSAAEYEIAVLAAIALPLLREVTRSDEHYAKAREIIARFSHIEAWPTDVVPAASLLREFIGDGAFDCH